MKPGIRPGQTPPFHELDEYTFQDLCRDLYSNEPWIATCELYGTRGQTQYGVDLIARLQDGDAVDVGQCKRYASFSAAEIRKASDDFLAHWDSRWSKERVRHFVLFVACDLNTTQQQDEITAQRARFAQLKVQYEVWAAATVRNKLRSQPGIVATYCDPAAYWVEAICGIAWTGSPWRDPSASPLISSLLASQFEELAALHSEDLRQRLESMRDSVREGRRTEALEWLRVLKGNHTEWAALSLAIQAQILRFEARLELEQGNIEAAESLVDEARTLAPTDDESTMRALIARERHDARTAMGLVQPPRTLQALNLLASLHLESGSVPQALEVLDRADGVGGPDAETYRLSALAYVFERDLGRARLAVQRAFDLAPRWVSVRLATAIVDYYSGLAPLAVPSQPVDWPEPVDWMVVRRDPESLSRFRTAADRFAELADIADPPEDHRKLYRIWRLACLANDPRAQAEALGLCTDLLDEDPADFEALAWATARSYELDLAASEAAINRRLAEGTAVVPHVIALSRAYLARREASKAIEVLERNRPLFSNPSADQLWTLLHAQALEANGAVADATQIGPTDPSANQVIVRQLQANLLLAQARVSNDWQALLNHLLESHEQTGEAEFLLQACEIMAAREQWEFVADQAKWLVEDVGTAEALRLAVYGSYRSKRPKQVLELLEAGRTFFESENLPVDLVRIRVESQVQLGILSAAITDAQTLVESDPSAENLLALASLHFTKGDLASVGQVARKAMQLPALNAEQALQIAVWTRITDRTLAILALRRALNLGLPDDVIAPALSIGFELGLDQEMGPLFQRLSAMATAGHRNVQVASLEDLASWMEQRRKESAEFDSQYRAGQIPIHLIAGHLPIPLVELYHRRVGQSATHPDPLHQFALLARHGGRGQAYQLSDYSPELRLHADVTAILLAAHFELLDAVEATFAPIRIPQSLIPALLRMRDAVTDNQPTRIAAQQDVERLLDDGSIHVVDCEEPNVSLDPEIVSEVGEHWARLLAQAKSDGGVVVDFLPLRKADPSGTPAQIPPEVQLQLVNCRAVVDSLRTQGPLSEQEHSRAVTALGSEGVVISPTPNQGTALHLAGGIAELLASAGVLRNACERFRVYVDKHDSERVLSTLSGYAQRHEVGLWLE